MTYIGKGVSDALLGSNTEPWYFRYRVVMLSRAVKLVSLKYRGDHRLSNDEL